MNKEEIEMLKNFINLGISESPSEDITKYGYLDEKVFNYINQLETNRDEAIKRCKYLLENNEVVINGKKYYKHSCDDIITKYILDSY